MEQVRLEGTSKDHLVQPFVGKGAYMGLSLTLSNCNLKLNPVAFPFSLVFEPMEEIWFSLLFMNTEGLAPNKQPTPGSLILTPNLITTPLPCGSYLGEGCCTSCPTSMYCSEGLPHWPLQFWGSTCRWVWPCRRTDLGTAGLPGAPQSWGPPELHLFSHLLCPAAVWSCSFPSHWVWEREWRSGNCRESSTAPPPSKSVTELGDTEDKEIEITYSHNLWQGVALSPLSSLTQLPLDLNELRNNPWEPALHLGNHSPAGSACMLLSVTVSALASNPHIRLDSNSLNPSRQEGDAFELLFLSVQDDLFLKERWASNLKVSGFYFGALACLSPIQSLKNFGGSGSLGYLLPVLDGSMSY